MKINDNLYFIIYFDESTIFIVSWSRGSRMLSSGTIYYLNEDEIVYYKKKSLEVNSDASIKLYQYYAF